MRLFSADLVRNFSIGFVLGTLLVVGANAQGWSERITPPAHAVTMPETLHPPAEFVVSPAERAL